MSYEVRLAGLLVGEAQLAVGEIGVVDGRRAVVVKSRIESAGAATWIAKTVDESTTVIDVERGSPLRVDTTVVNGATQTTVATTFRGSVADIVFQRGSDPARTTHIDFKNEAVHDMHTAMAALRNWRGTGDETKSVYIIGGRRMWRITLHLVGEETLGARGGNRRAVVLEGKTYRARNNLTVDNDKPSRTFKVWLSDDADRVPLKCAAATELGDIVMELVDYSAP